MQCAVLRAAAPRIPRPDTLRSAQDYDPPVDVRAMTQSNDLTACAYISGRPGDSTQDHVDGARTLAAADTLSDCQYWGGHTGTTETPIRSFAHE